MPESVSEQLNRHLYHSIWPMLNTATGAVALAAVASRTLAAQAVVIWLTVVFGVSLVRLLAFRAFNGQPPAHQGDRRWSDLFVLLMTLQGLVFGLSSLAMFLTPDLLTHLTVVMTVVGLGAGVMAIYAADLRVVAGFIAAAFVPVILACLALQDMLHVVTALLMTLFGGNLLIIGVTAHRNLIQTLMVRHDREQLAQALIAEKTRTELASRAKSDFLATMSHELRTPLNAIIGFSEVMLGEIFGPLGAARYSEYCGDIHTSAQHLLSLINDILDSAKIEAGKYELREEVTDLPLLAKSAARLMRGRAAQKGLTFTLDLKPVPSILADERAMRQILLNLLSNAIKFTPGGGSVSLRTVYSESGAVLLEVHDTGIGIPEADIDNVFDNFSRASNAHLSNESGTGLGLPIVRGLVQLHGGDLRIDSRPGAGTTVTVELPASRILAVAA
jgi:two-component system cell cycle sensor histidine kinase PleC